MGEHTSSPPSPLSMRRGSCTLLRCTSSGLLRRLRDVGDSAADAATGRVCVGNASVRVAQYLDFHFPRPQDILMTPAKVVALLIGHRPSHGGDAAAPIGDSKSGSEEPRAAPLGMSRDAIGLAVLIFVLSAAWEVFSSYKGWLLLKVQECLYLSLEVRSSQQEYMMILDWLRQQPESERSRNVTLMPAAALRWTGERGEGEDATANSGADLTAGSSTGTVVTPLNEFVPGRGVHRVQYEDRTLWITRAADESKAKGQRFGDYEDERLSIMVFSRDRAILDRFIASVRAVWRAKAHQYVQIYVRDGAYWKMLCMRQKRAFKTLYYPEHVGCATLRDAQRFFGMRSAYQVLGVPWRRGYLFEGPPGTGKSSLIFALAGELGVPIYLLSLRGKDLSDADLLHLVNTVSPRSLLVIEDIENALMPTDGVGAAVDGDSNSSSAGGGGVSVSGLLNALDGFGASEGRLLVMTSNNSSRLPARDALLRPGRIDRHVKFEAMKSAQVEDMVQNYVSCVPGYSDPAHMKVVTERILERVQSATGVVTPAEVQNTLLDSILLHDSEALRHG